MGKENQLMRVENWSSKLELTIEKTKNKEKFIFGKNDCVTFVINSIEAITGKKVFDNKYKTIKDAKEIIKSLKSKDLYLLLNTLIPVMVSIHLIGKVKQSFLPSINFSLFFNSLITNSPIQIPKVPSKSVLSL